MHEQARSEQEIVKALGEALKRADDQLLVAIRNIALEHEMRREGILRELQALATRPGTFPTSRVLAPAAGRITRLAERRDQSASGDLAALAACRATIPRYTQFGSDPVFRWAQTGARPGRTIVALKDNNERRYKNTLSSSAA
jgi:hypothetical protein